jgi:glycerate kinase
VTGTGDPRGDPRGDARDPRGDARRTVLIAPDSFKGSLTSVEVASALADGWRSVRPDDVVVLAPLADGGEGTMAAIEAAGGWTRESATVADPLGRPIPASWLRNGDRAVVEMAAASGLSRVRPEERDALAATSRGTGELIVAAIDAGCRDIVLGIGGSATSDGARGLLEALGAVVRPDGSIDLWRLDPRLAETRLEVACDVTNPLLGPRGAAATYGPQKGATPELVAVLDARLARWADALDAATGTDCRDLPGAGAAGGVGFGLLAIGGRLAAFGLQPGVELVMEAVGFTDRLAAADLVLTGEGRIDAQTAFGKTALGVARLARAAGVRCIAVGGGVEPEGIEALGELGVEVVPVWESPVPLAEAMAAGAAPLARCGARIAGGVAASPR